MEEFLGQSPFAGAVEVRIHSIYIMSIVFSVKLLALAAVVSSSLCRLTSIKLSHSPDEGLVCGAKMWIVDAVR